MALHERGATIDNNVSSSTLCVEYVLFCVVRVCAVDCGSGDVGDFLQVLLRLDNLL